MRQWLVVLFMVIAVSSIPCVTMAESPKDIALAPICYVKIDGSNGTIKDESAANRNQEIEGLGVSYGVEIAGNRSAPPTGVAIGRPQPEALIITKTVSASTPKLFEAMLKHEPIRSAEIKFVRPSAHGGAEVYYTLTLHEPMISNIHQFSDGIRFLEDVSIIAQRIDIVYDTQTPPKPIKSEFHYDFKSAK